MKKNSNSVNPSKKQRYILPKFLNIWSHLPLNWLYNILNFTRLVIFNIFKYRRKVTNKNIDIVFPDRNKTEQKAIRTAFEKHFCDLLAESLKLPNLSSEELKRRFDIQINEDMKRYIAAGKDIIIAGAHINNWEWAVTAGGQQLPCRAVGIYKPIHHQGMEYYIKTNRQRHGTEMIAMANVVRDMLRKDRMSSAYFFLSDQSTPFTDQAHYVDFFGIKTPFVPGMSQLASRLNLPIFYFYIKKTKRGYYTAHFTTLLEESSTLTPTEITDLYVKKLTDNILNESPNWLWTHKRWKRVLKY
ncbi:lysophospholipid acyltransferase family protein [Membranihabitans marinus]|uniref:lysophospholipid acyltransferase family protein n=1 Tax=Membranihabitans marinus TaxID=1227546 RepID=UPI001F42D11E|nr:lysophospholipid acyltransferase family protein [Membranihabitans marinus]